MRKLTVNFYLKADKVKNGLCPIYGKIKLAGTTATFSTSRYISKERWEKTNRLLNSLKIGSEISLRNFIYSIPRQVDDAYSELVRSSLPTTKITALQLKNSFWGIPKSPQEIGFIEVLDFHISNFKLKAAKNERSAGSKEKYIRMEKVVKEYILKKYKQHEIPFSMVDSDFVFGRPTKERSYL